MSGSAGYVGRHNKREERNGVTNLMAHGDEAHLARAPGFRRDAEDGRHAACFVADAKRRAKLDAPPPAPSWIDWTLLAAIAAAALLFPRIMLGVLYHL